MGGVVGEVVHLTGEVPAGIAGPGVGDADRVEPSAGGEHATSGVSAGGGRVTSGLETVMVISCWSVPDEMAQSGWD